MSNGLRPRCAEVWLHEHHVGWLYEVGGAVRFLSTESYLANRNRQTLSFSTTVPGADALTQRILTNRFDPAIYRERGLLPPFFSGLLAEGTLRRRLMASRVNPQDMDDLGILVAAGEDLPGAVKVIPASKVNLTREARIYIAGNGTAQLDIDVPEGATAGAASLAGVQDKLALAVSTDNSSYRIPLKGQLSNLIVKLPAAGDDSQVMNEYACMQLAALAGVQVAHCRPALMENLTVYPRLVDAIGREKRFLAVDRFDREASGAVHVEDACQLLTLMPSQKYAGDRQFTSLLALLNQLSPLGIQDVRQLLIRRVVNTLLGNSDAHLKNIGILYADGVRPQLSPAYDIVCVSALAHFRGLAVNVAIDRYQKSETVSQYEDLAKEAGISPRIARTVVKQTVSYAKELWPEAIKGMDIPIAVRAEILQRLGSLPLAARY